PTNITGWTARNSGTGAISHDAVNFRLTLTGGGAGNEARAYQSIERIGIKQYTVTLDVFTTTITYRVGTTAGDSSIATGTLTTGTGKTFTFTSSTNQTVFIEFECAATASIDNVVLSNSVYAIDNPYTTAHCADLVMAQSFDTIYITHPNYTPR